MKKLNTSPISGTQELLPTSQANFDNLKSKIKQTFKLHGFLNIETPVLERSEILFAKAGGDTEKQIYKVIKTSESAEDSTEALRFDHTVPLARYVVEHENDLAFPFKVFQIGENFRGERAQKGRFREFYQCDVDIIGRQDLPLFYDADIISTLLDTFTNFGLSTPVLARISNRKILKGLLESFNLEEKSQDIYSIIDHAEKVPPEKTVSSLTEIGLTESEKTLILNFINLTGKKSEIIPKLNELNLTNETFKAGVAELATVLETLEKAGHGAEITADMKIIRGLDYYTSTVFEFILPKLREIGSIGGGGRYDNLTAYFSEQKFPGVGGSIGLSRLFYILNEKGLLKASFALIDYAIIPMSDNELAFAFKTAKELRSKGALTTIIASDKKLGDKLKYASKIATSAIVLGEDEAKSGTYEVKKFI